MRVCKAASAAAYLVFCDSAVALWVTKGLVVDKNAVIFRSASPAMPEPLLEKVKSDTAAEAESNGLRVNPGPPMLPNTTIL